MKKINLKELLLFVVIFAIVAVVIDNFRSFQPRKQLVPDATSNNTLAVENITSLPSRSVVQVSTVVQADSGPDWPSEFQPTRQLTIPHDNLIDATVFHQTIREEDYLFPGEDVLYPIKNGWKVALIIHSDLSLVNVAYDNKVIIPIGQEPTSSTVSQIRIRSKNTERISVIFNMKR